MIKSNPDIVVLAGWMHVLGTKFLDALGAPKPSHGEDKLRRPIPVINLHPALPGAFDGANAIERSYEAFQKGEITHSGVMVHRVIKEVDRGEPIIVKELSIKKEESLEDFANRLHETEWKIIVDATAIVLEESALPSVSYATLHERIILINADLQS